MHGWLAALLQLLGLGGSGASSAGGLVCGTAAVAERVTATAAIEEC